MKKIFFLTLFIFIFISTQSIAQNLPYLENTIIIKLKASDNDLKSTYPFLSPQQELSDLMIEDLHISKVEILFQKEHALFKSSRIGKRTKALSLLRKITLNEEVDFQETLQILRKQDFIVYAEPLYKHQSLIVPNDPEANPSDNPPQYHLKNIQAYDAWDLSIGSSNSVIAITDNSFDLANTDLQNQFVLPSTNYGSTGMPQADIADGDNDVLISGEGHGTIVALMSSAEVNNGQLGAGVGFDCKFMPIKVAFDSDPNGYIFGYEGILYAAEQPNVKVVNMSWGRRGISSQFEIDMLETAIEDYDVVLVASAGNDNTEDLFFPASYEDLVVSVAATDIDDKKASFSTYNNLVDISAPGEDVNYGGAVNSGTSFASPIVAAAVALIDERYASSNLTSKQIVARLKTTADDIYGVDGNDAFEGKLGTGRLNLFRALNDDFIAITLDNLAFSNTERGHVFTGVQNLVGTFTNQLDAVSNLQVELNVDSPFITITQATSNLGAVGANTTIDNNSTPFVIEIADNIPVNSEVLFSFTYTEGTYTYTEEKYMIINPGIIDNNRVKFTVGDEGKLGVFNHNYRNELIGYAYDLDNDENQVLPLLTEAGLMITYKNLQDEELVSDAVRSGVGATDNNFTRSIPFTQNTTGTLLETSTTFEDITGNADRIGLNITQNTLSWNETELEKGVIVEYQIQYVGFIHQDNEGNSIEILDSVRVGFFADWNILLGNENRAEWDATNALGYVNNTDIAVDNRLYAGIKVLGNQDLADTIYYALDNTKAINVNDGFTDSEKFLSMSQGIAEESAGQTGDGLDVSQVIGATIAELKVGEIKTVAFAWVVGEDLTSIQSTSEALRNKYVEERTSPLPIVSDLEVCEGESVTITPENGEVFKFYTISPDLPGAFAIHTGASLTLSNISENAIYYVTSDDNVFESAGVAVNITVIEHQNDFTLENESEISIPLNLSGVSSDATQWTWEITIDGGSPNENITFTSGDANSQNPQIQFNKTGIYTITLTTQNSDNCTTSTSKSIEVFRDVTTGLFEDNRRFIKLFPNPVQDKLNIDLGELTGITKLKLFDAQGRLVVEKTIFAQNKKLETLNLAGLSKGIYNLKITWEGKSITKKVIVE